MSEASEQKRAAALAALEVAEQDYLRASGWHQSEFGLWFHLRHTPAGKSHIARVASYKQRQIDAAEVNARAKAVSP